MRHKVLSIAGLDPSGGAGLLADVKTFSALGCYGMAVVTAITAQNTMGVSGVFKVETHAIVAQLESILDDITPDAIKIGMLFDEEIITAVAAVLKKHLAKNAAQKNGAKNFSIVLDPVMMAKSGDALLQPSAIKALRDVLIPLTDIITPNLREAEALLASDDPITHDTMAARARDLLQLGSKSVLLKGGHLIGDVADDYYIMGNDGGLWLPGRRIDTKNTHGTGCTLSSAIASGLARGLDMPAACQAAKKYLTGALLAVEKKSVGGGAGPLHHFYEIWKK
ncbi:MAG: bifunctional hydroxymethylpyrimidine kinase/phosphomethylpyrimidine kinase [Hydrotalea sp.]|nr:bifunctional hydroxymethylpyrimidine kinase/phosphomethylpyrimidine kinase [Hydrotalea sp.]